MVTDLPENGEVEFAGDMKMGTGVTTTELPEGAVVSVNNKQFAAGPGGSILDIVQSPGINMPLLLRAGTVELSDSKTSDVTVYSDEIDSVIGSVRCISGTACVSGTSDEEARRDFWKLIVIGNGTFETSDAQGKHLETFVISDSGKWATITSDNATFTCEVTELRGKNPEIEFLHNASTELKADDFTWITTRNVSAGKTVELPAVSGTTKHAGDYETVIYHSGADGGYYKDKSNYASFTVSDPQNDPNYRLILNNDVEKVSFTFDMKPLGNKSVKIENVSLGTGSVTYQLKNGANIKDVVSHDPRQADVFTIAGNVVDAEKFTLSSGTVDLKAAQTQYKVTTAAGEFWIDNKDATGDIRISAEGKITNYEVGDIIALHADDNASDTDITEFTIGKTVFKAYKAEGAELIISDDETILKSGKVALSQGDKLTVGNVTININFSSDSVSVDSKGRITGLTDGDIVKATGTNNTTTYTVSDGKLQVDTTGASPSSNVYVLSPGETSFEIKTNQDGTSDTAPLATIAEPGTATADLNVNGVAITSIADNLYVDKNGNPTLNESKATSKFEVGENQVTYTVNSDSKRQTITVGDDANRDSWVIRTENRKNTITYEGTADATIGGGSGDTINVTDSATGRGGDVMINLKDGKNVVTLTTSGNASIIGGTGNDTIKVSGAGDCYLEGNSGNDLIEHTGKGVATIMGGAGDDTIKAAGDNDVVSGGDDADTFNVSTSSMTISDYNYGEDVLQVVTTSGGIVAAPGNFSGEGVVSITGGTGTYKADVSAGTGTGNYYAVSLVDKDGRNRQNVAWAKDGGSNIDVTSYDKAVILIGNEDGANNLYAGKKADTIYSYADNDSVYGGEGSDSIILKANGKSRVVGIATTAGKDTVSGFTTGFEDSDSIFIVDGDASGIKASFDESKKTVSFKDGEGSLELQGITAAATGAAEVMISGARLALAAENGTITANVADYADVYIGKKSAVSFAAADNNVNVNLGNGLTGSGEGAKFVGITAVTGGSGKNTLIGSNGSDVITAGTGESTLWGGAGKDTLVGSSGKDVFYIGAGDSSDTIDKFTAGGEDADILFTTANITNAKLTSNGVAVYVSENDKAILSKLTANDAFRVNNNGKEIVAKVGSASNANDFSYDNSVTYYGGGSANDKISVSSNYPDAVNIWLDGSKGVLYNSIDVVDAGNAAGSVLVAGDSSSQTIVGGKGSSTLWGGAGSAADTLKGSSGGTSMFFWGTDEGKDIVQSNSANDSVNLYSVKLADVDLTKTAITNSGVTLALNDGSMLTVQTTHDITFLVDGTSWTAQHNSKTW